MAKLTTRTPATSTAADDILHIVDTSDTTDDPGGTSKQITVVDFLNIIIANGQNKTITITNNDTTNNQKTLNIVSSTLSGVDMEITNTGASSTSKLLRLVQTSGSGTGSLLTVENSGKGNGMVIAPNGNLNDFKFGLDIYTNTAQTSTSSALLRVRSDNAASASTLSIFWQDGSGVCQELQSNGNGAHLRFTGDPTNPTPTDGDLWFDGTNLKIRIGATTYNVDVTPA